MRNGLQALNWGSFFPGVRLGWRTPVALAAVLALVFALLRWASQAPPILHGPKLELGSGALVLYAAYSLARMLGAYLLSLAFTFTYGTWAARSAAARAILLPLLDVLQSVPIPLVFTGGSSCRHGDLPTGDRRRAGGRGAAVHQPGVESHIRLVPVADHRTR